MKGLKINEGSRLNCNSNLIHELISAIGIGLLFLASIPAARAQSTLENSKSPAAKNAEIYSDHNSVSESSSLQDPQQPTTVPPASRCGFTSSKQCLKDFLNDQKGIWTSPLRIKPRDVEWLLPFAAATAVSLHFDAQAISTLGVSHSRDVISDRVSDAGSPFVMAGFAASAFLIGHFTHNEKVKETGLLSGEALADTAVLTEVMKYATNRERPSQGIGTGRFYPDGFNNYPAGVSMPSGHAASAFAVAKVISDETPGNIWLHVGLYGFATAIGAARITGHQHFPTDVLVGGTFGYLIGGYVFRHHSADAIRRSHGVMFGMMPISDANTHTYGLTIVTNGSIFQGDWRLPNPFRRKG